MRERLIALLKERSYRRMRVVLASGRRSDFYVDGKQTTLNAEGAWLVGNLVLDALLPEVEAVGGLVIGADPIASATAAQPSASRIEFLKDCTWSARWGGQRQGEPALAATDPDRQRPVERLGSQTCHVFAGHGEVSNRPAAPRFPGGNRFSFPLTPSPP